MTALPPLHLPARARHELGFSDVERILAGACATPFGREALLRDVFPETLEDLEARMEEVLEAAHLVTQRSLPDFASIRDVRPHLEHADKEAVLGALEVLEVARTLDGLARLKDLVESRGDEVARLVAVASAIEDERPFARRVFRSIDEQGQITDDASPTLAELRARVRALRVEAQERLEGLIRDLDDAGLLRDRNFTLRNDRYVLPVRAELQGRVEGIVHDASQTGQTVYIEPRQLLDVGNRIKIARAAVLEEEARILGELTTEIRLRSAQLASDLERAGVLEAGFARGTFAARTRASKPVVVSPEGKRQSIELFEARHPLLSWMTESARLAGQPAEEVVPNDIGFDGRSVLVITGPNAGGKTVALKTVGLSTLLVRAGMPIPAGEGSRVPIASAVLSTVGDQQSLDEALSSFSGHLVALRGILDSAREHAERGVVLCLLDEIASGTDPGQGAALAQALLEELTSAGALVVATTHYERLKLLALQETEAENPFRNASVALDPDTHRPTFHLRLDQVGTSNALDAARRYGLPERVLARAESLLDSKERDVQALLSRLAEEHSVLERRVEQVENERARLESERERLQRRLDEVEREAARLRREGTKAFQHELQSARKVVANAIERAQKGADARELNELSHQLREQERRAAEAVQPKRSQEALAPLAEVRPGDRVELATLPGTRLEVLEVNGDEVVLAKGAMKLRAERSALRKAKGQASAKDVGKDAPARTRPLEAAPARSEPRTSENTLDVRGERVGEALELMEAFLDRVLKDGRTRAYVLHGHGTGALKRAVRDALSSSRYVARFGAADPDDGGDACTAVELADVSIAR